MPRKPKMRISIGDKFSRWTVIEKGTPNKWGYSTWVCRCECGNIRTIAQSELIQGRTKSCGCYRRELSSKQHIKHGGCNDRLYEIWHSMKSRCSHDKKTLSKRYAGIGIKVCDEWADSYEEFKKWALENGYNENAKQYECTIDRIKPDGDYCPENCRWVNAKLQSNNRHNTIYLSLDGVTKPIAIWADDIGISLDVLYHRYKSGWAEKDILTKPVRRYRKDIQNGSEEICETH